MELRLSVLDVCCKSLSVTASVILQTTHILLKCETSSIIDYGKRWDTNCSKMEVFSWWVTFLQKPVSLSNDIYTCCRLCSMQKPEDEVIQKKTWFCIELQPEIPWLNTRSNKCWEVFSYLSLYGRILNSWILHAIWKAVF